MAGKRPTKKTMGMREFMRGGYKDITEPTAIMNHSNIAGTWIPGDTGVSINYATDVTDFDTKRWFTPIGSTGGSIYGGSIYGSSKPITFRISSDLGVGKQSKPDPDDE